MLRAVFINKSEAPLTVKESFEDVKKMLYKKKCNVLDCLMSKIIFVWNRFIRKISR